MKKMPSGMFRNAPRNFPRTQDGFALRSSMCRYNLFIAMSVLFFATIAAADLSVQRYLRTDIDQAGELRIITTDGHAITFEKEAKQVAFEKIAISPTGNAVGWVGLRKNCCTSYPIPTRLFVYSNGIKRSYRGTDLLCVKLDVLV
ncbi:MAG: hypothetical protein ACTFAL_07170 [Candidatus Electronema sp. V4]|uniref:hypothetical protein n=1 Tax=Candidatus Electronema sp. V4 TaxID=3454756 RepID=UPI00405543B5